MDRNDLMCLLDVGFEIKRPYFIWGSMGIGKSYTVRKFAEKKASELKKEFVAWNEISLSKKQEVFSNPEMYFVFVDMRASEMTLDDFKVPKLNGEFFEYKIPMVFSLLVKENASGILFFDEFNLAKPSIQSAFYQLINDRQIGEWKISDGVYILGAGNNSEDSTAVYEMSLPLLDRFEHIELDVPSLEEWQEWAMQNDVDEDIIAFLNFKPSMLFYSKEDAKAFPTPRGWHWFSIAYKKVKGKDKSLIRKLAECYVGQAASSFFMAFLDLKQKFNIYDLLENPKMLTEIDLTPDLKYSIVSEIVNIVKKDISYMKKAIVLCDMFEEEFALSGFKMLKKIDEVEFKKNFGVLKDTEKYVKYFVGKS